MIYDLYMIIYMYVLDRLSFHTTYEKCCVSKHNFSNAYRKICVIPTSLFKAVNLQPFTYSALTTTILVLFI